MATGPVASLPYSPPGHLKGQRNLGCRMDAGAYDGKAVLSGTNGTRGLGARAAVQILELKCGLWRDTNRIRCNLSKTYRPYQRQIV